MSPLTAITIFSTLLMTSCNGLALWTRSTARVVAPKVSGQACCDLDDNGGLLLFGGLLPDRTATNELWIHKQQEWNKAKATNDDAGPGPRMYATAARLGENVFVIGGWDPEAKGSGGTFKDEVFSINTKTMQWTKHPPLPCGPVSRHTACTVTTGGSDNKEMIVIHTYKEGDESVLVLEAGGTCRTQPTTGPAPIGISMCSVAVLGNTMVLFGGSSKNQVMSEFVYTLDTDTWQWTKLQSRGDVVPTARASTCMAAVDDDDSTCLVFGGAGMGKGGYEGGAGLQGSDETWLLQVNGDYADWTLLKDNDDDDDAESPPARVAASLNKLGKNTKKFLLTGGWDPATAETFEEPWMIEL